MTNWGRDREDRELEMLREELAELRAAVERLKAEKEPPKPPRRKRHLTMLQGGGVVAVGAWVWRYWRQEAATLAVGSVAATALVLRPDIISPEELRRPPAAPTQTVSPTVAPPDTTRTAPQPSQPPRRPPPPSAIRSAPPSTVPPTTRPTTSTTTTRRTSSPTVSPSPTASQSLLPTVTLPPATSLPPSTVPRPGCGITLGPIDVSVCRTPHPRP